MLGPLADATGAAVGSVDAGLAALPAADRFGAARRIARGEGPPLNAAD
eukprot:gene2244-10027_t